MIKAKKKRKTSLKFDNENEDSSLDVMDILELLQISRQNSSKPPKVPKFLSSAESMPGLKDATLTPLYEETDNDYVHSHNSKSAIDSDTEKKGSSKSAGGLMRSMSYTARKYNCRESFGEMSEDEWSLFLDCFEKLLPEVFEDSKNIVGLKQRLGTSCKF